MLMRDWYTPVFAPGLIPSVSRVWSQVLNLPRKTKKRAWSQAVLRPDLRALTGLFPRLIQTCFQLVTNTGFLGSNILFHRLVITTNNPNTNSHTRKFADLFYAKNHNLILLITIVLSLLPLHHRILRVECSTQQAESFSQYEKNTPETYLCSLLSFLFAGLVTRLEMSRRTGFSSTSTLKTYASDVFDYELTFPTLRPSQQGSVAHPDHRRKPVLPDPVVWNIHFHEEGS